MTGPGRLDRDVIELPPWGRDERDVTVEDLETVLRRLVVVLRILLEVARRD